MATPAEVIEQSMASGFDQGLQRRHQNQDFRKNTEWEDKHNDLREAVKNNLLKLSNLPRPDPKSPTYAQDQAEYEAAHTQGRQDLTNSIQAYQDFTKQPHVWDKIRAGLGMDGKPHPQTVTTTPSAVQLPPSASGPTELAATPAYTPASLPSQRKEVPGVETATLPSTSVTSPTLPADKPVTVKGPSKTPHQLKIEADSLQKAQKQAGRMEAGGPPSAEETAVREAQAGSAGTLASIRGAMQNFQTLNPNATPEDKQSYLNDLLRNTSGTKPGSENYKTQSIILSDGTVVSAQQDTKSGKWLDLNKNPIPQELLAGAKIEPKAVPKKGLKYETTTGEVVNQDDGKRYSVADLGKSGTPPEVAQMFQDSKAMMDTKQKNALALATQRGAAYGQQRYGDYIDPSNSTAVVSMPNIEAQKKGLHRAAGPAYQAEAGMLKASTYGPIGNEIVAFSTAIAHADLLEQAATALNNNETQKLNQIANEAATQFGDPAPTNFNTIANAYTREVTKALTSGHVTDNEIRENGATIPQDASPEQIIGAINAYRKLMNSKIAIRRQQIDAGMTGTPFLGAGATPLPTGTTTAPSKAPPGAAHIVQHEGKSYYVDKDGNNLGEKTN